MPARYDPLLVRHLVRDILVRWEGLRLSALALDAARRAAELTFEDGSSLLALLHPTAGYIAARARGDVEAGAERTLVGTSVEEVRFGRLYLGAAEAPPDERALLLTFVDHRGRPREGLAIELQTTRWNALHLAIDRDAPEIDRDAPETDRSSDDSAPRGPDEKADSAAPGSGDAVSAAPARTLPWRIREALWVPKRKDRSYRPGSAYVPPASDREGIDEPPSREAWADFFGELPDSGARGALLSRWAWTSSINFEYVLGDRADAARARERLLELHPARGGDRTAGAWLLPRAQELQPYPHPLGEAGAERTDSLLEGLAAAAAAAGGVTDLLEGLADEADEARARSERGRLRAELERARERAARRAGALERELEGTAEPEAARTFGQLILARKDRVPRGSSTAHLESFDGTETVEVELDPALDAVANAERYFDEARRRERARERIPLEMKKARDREAEIADALERLEAGGPDDAAWELVGGRPERRSSKRRADGADDDERLPYTRLRSSGGLEIRVGRGARDNDALTFHHSAPDDIWLHAHQAAGAHVVLRWGRREENPPRRDLLEAAVAAAVHSRARHSGSVPVVWTRRKYVRKPRKSPPGAVVPDRVETLFVKPDEAVVDELRERG